MKLNVACSFGNVNERIAESKGLDNLIINSAFTDLPDYKIIKVELRM